SEFSRTSLTYVDKASGQELAPICPEITQTPAPDGSGSASGLPAISDQAKDSGPPVEFHGYDLLRSLDAGGMAEAYVARNRETGQRVFLKRVRRNSADKDALQREMGIYDRLMRMSTPHVLQVLDFIRDDEYFALVTEFADDGDLQMHVEARGNGRGLPVQEAKQIALSVATALRELHDHDIVHRDLKPDNVLSLGGCWKLA